MNFPSRNFYSQYISSSFQDVLQQYILSPTSYVLDGYGNVVFTLPSSSIGQTVITSDVTSSMTVLSASYSNVIETYKISSSFASSSISSSYALTASYALNSNSGSSISSSYALSSSYFIPGPVSTNLYLQADDGFTYQVSLVNDNNLIAFAIGQIPKTGSNGFINIGTISNPTSIKTIINNYTASQLDYTILSNNTSSININIPSNLPTGSLFNIKSINSGSINITPTTPILIDNQSTQTIKTQYTSMTIQYDGNNFWIL